MKKVTLQKDDKKLDVELNSLLDLIGISAMSSINKASEITNKRVSDYFDKGEFDRNRFEADLRLHTLYTKEQANAIEILQFLGTSDGQGNRT